ncbi:MAG TPA: HAD family hydrolase [Burkholderiaceae bacterium]|nr:HAD family hydrolase [Burkholderiaceae bacterium]
MNLTLFDLDGTLIATDSDHAFGEFLVERGWADREGFRRRNDAFYADYLAGKLDQAAYIDFATAPWRQRDTEEALALREAFVHARVLPVLHEPARALVRRHQAAGDRVAIVTATNEFITRPIADLFGVTDLIALELERDADGRVTGRIRGVPSFREGKIARVEQWLASQGLNASAFERTTVYSDSVNDLPLLEWCTHPVATNPGPSLATVAQERGWPILRLFEAIP